MTSRPFQLHTIVVGDEPSAWANAGFDTTGDRLRIGSTTIVCRPGDHRGIVAVGIDGLSAPVDGLTVDADRADEPSTADHANHVTTMDHLVVMSPAIERTADALLAAGIERRRTRRFEAGGEARRQDFFWLGDVILELVGLDGAEDPGLPEFWGLALECADLDAAAQTLGDRLGTVKDAIQTGRRIATVRTRDLGVSVPIALMSPHRAT